MENKHWSGPLVTLYENWRQTAFNAAFAEAQRTRSKPEQGSASNRAPHCALLPRRATQAGTEKGRGLSEAAGRVPQPPSRTSSAGHPQRFLLGAEVWARRSLATFCRRTESGSPSRRNSALPIAPAPSEGNAEKQPSQAPRAPPLTTEKRSRRIGSWRPLVSWGGRIAFPLPEAKQVRRSLKNRPPVPRPPLRSPQGRFGHGQDLLLQFADARLPVGVGVEPGEGGGKGRVVPAPRQPGAVVEQAQGAQGFHQA